VRKLSVKKRPLRLEVVQNRGNSWLLDEGQVVLVACVVVANATRTRIMGIHDGLLKIQLAAPPTHDRANATLIAFVADKLGIPKAQISLTAGGTSRRKRLRISHVSFQAALLALSPSPA
jgi:uncharacterized protein (TIGR00251 family)